MEQRPHESPCGDLKEARAQVNNLTVWQQSQNGHLREIDRRLSQDMPERIEALRLEIKRDTRDLSDRLNAYALMIVGGSGVVTAVVNALIEMARKGP